MKGNYDVLKAFDQAKKRQLGLPDNKPKKVETEEKKVETEEKNNASLGEKTKNEGEQNKTSIPSENIEKESVEDSESVPEYRYENTKSSVNVKNENELFKEGSQESEESVNEGLKSKNSLEKLRGSSSKVIINQGDKLQAALAKLIFDWRGENGLHQAEKYRDVLIDQLSKSGSLNPKEVEALSYAREYIRKYELRKEDFNKDVYLSKEDKEELIELLGDYLSASDFKPSPLLLIAGIICITLFSNLYTAFNHPRFNPPL